MKELKLVKYHTILRNLLEIYFEMKNNDTEVYEQMMDETTKKLMKNWLENIDMFNKSKDIWRELEQKYHYY